MAVRAYASHWENGRLVTDWRYDISTVYGGYRVGLMRWVRGREGWDEEQGEWAHEAPFETALQAIEIANELNRAIAAAG